MNIFTPEEIEYLTKELEFSLKINEENSQNIKKVLGKLNYLQKDSDKYFLKYFPRVMLPLETSRYEDDEKNCDDSLPFPVTTKEILDKELDDYLNNN